jgi:hypothetical protein
MTIDKGDDAVAQKKNPSQAKELGWGTHSEQRSQ